MNEKIEDAFLGDLKSVLETREGRAVLMAILEQTGPDASSAPIDGPTDVGAVMFNEGSRAVGVWLKSAILRLGRGYLRRMEDDADAEALARLDDAERAGRGGWGGDD